MVKAYFRKKEHACGTDKKGYISVNSGQFEDETLQNIMQI